MPATLAALNTVGYRMDCPGYIYVGVAIYKKPYENQADRAVHRYCRGTW